MMIYLDDQFRAYAGQDAETTLMPWEDTGGFFTGKCDTFIEGYRVVPEDKTWIRADGMVFSGLMIAPLVNPLDLLARQAVTDAATIADLDTQVVDLAYQNVLLELDL